MRFLIPSCTILVGGLIVLSSCLPEPPSNNQGWGQQKSQPQQSGWGQPAQQSSGGGWGQQKAQQSQGGWGPPPQQSSGGWGQEQSQSSGGGWGQDSSSGKPSQSGHKGKGDINWGLNFALGYQGEKGQGGGGGGGGGGGWGSGGGGGDMSGGSVGWSSEPETNVKKPSIGDIFRGIIAIPRQIKDLFKESGLWILFLPLIVIIPLLFVAFSLGKFLGGFSGAGWGWDKRSSASAKAFYTKEWESLKGFLKDPKVQQAAQGFMDEFVVKRIMTSTSEESKVTSSSTKDKSS